MGHARTCTIPMIGLAVGLAAAGAFAQTIGVGPYYATPSWDQTLPASTRFIVLSNFNNDAVLDRETGLVWQRSPSTQQVYSNAIGGCATANTGGRQGWRVPHLSEFESLVDATVASHPMFPAGHPFTGFPTSSGAGALVFWTDTAVPGQTGQHYCPGYGRSAFSGAVIQILASCIDANAGAYLFCVRAPGATGP
jgi:hypothetical protein